MDECIMVSGEIQTKTGCMSERMNEGMRKEGRKNGN